MTLSSVLAHECDLMVVGEADKDASCGTAHSVARTPAAKSGQRQDLCQAVSIEQAEAAPDLMLVATVSCRRCHCGWSGAAASAKRARIPERTLTHASAHLKEDVMEGQAMFLDCPAYLNSEGAAQCEVACRGTRSNTAAGRWVTLPRRV
jgi:hypothetical protein